MSSSDGDTSSDDGGSWAETFGMTTDATLPDLPDADGRRVAVVGGGAVGVTAAHDLALAGAEVTLFERGDLAAGSSGRAAGVVYDAFAEDVDAAIGDRSLSRFRAFSGEGAFEFVDCPYVMLARDDDPTNARAIEAAVDRMRVHDRDVTLVDGDELGDRFSELRTDDVAVAGVAENAGWTDPASYVRMMGARAADAGVTVRTGVEARLAPDGPGVVDADGGAVEGFDSVVVAVGAHTKRFFADAGIAVPLKPYRVQALVGGDAYDGPMCYDASTGFYLRPHPTGLLVGDGTVPVEADPDEWVHDADEWFVDETRSRLRDRAGYDGEVARAWAGLCTATPDGNPLLGEIRDGVFVAAGWQGHGFMRAPATAEAIARIALGGDEVPGFEPGRFVGDEDFPIVEGMSLEEDGA